MPSRATDKRDNAGAEFSLRACSCQRAPADAVLGVHVARIRDGHAAIGG